MCDKNFLKNACKKFPNKIALGLDAKDGYLSVSGWKENSNQLTLDYLKEVNDYGASRLIYTDINRDGMKQSPNFDETEKVADTSNCPVIISGGVSSIDDVKKAKKINNNNNKITIAKLAKLLSCTSRTIHRNMGTELKREKELLNKQL